MMERIAGLGLAAVGENAWGSTVPADGNMAGLAHKQAFHKVAGIHRISRAEEDVREWGRNDKRPKYFPPQGRWERYIQPVEAVCSAVYKARAAVK